MTPCQRAPRGSFQGAIRRGTDGSTEPGKPRVSPVRRSPIAVTGGFESPGGTLVVTGRTTPSGATGFSTRPELFVHPILGWGVLSFPGFPASRGGMASSTAPDAPAAMVVNLEAEGAGALFGPEEDIDEDVLSNLLSASWPTPAVVDAKYGRYPWAPLGGSIFEQRFDAVGSRRMTSIWTTIRGMYHTLFAVPEGKVTDFPFLRSREHWRVCQVLRHLAVREMPPEVGDKPHFSWDYYPGYPPKLGEMERGFFMPGTLGEWTVRTSLHLLTLYEQREVRDVPVVRRKALYPTTPVWWEHFEVPRGMAARVPQMVALQGIQLMGEPLGGPYHLMLAALWAVEVADVFLGSIRHHGHLWRLPMAIRSAFADLKPERLCSPTLRPAFFFRPSGSSSDLSRSGRRPIGFSG